MSYTHGTYAAYGTHKCRCDQCRTYQRQRVAMSRRRRLAEGRVNHGTSSGYDDGCRCHKCRLAKSYVRSADFEKAKRKRAA